MVGLSLTQGEDSTRSGPSILGRQDTALARLGRGESVVRSRAESPAEGRRGHRRLDLRRARSSPSISHGYVAIFEDISGRKRFERERDGSARARARRAPRSGSRKPAEGRVPGDALARAADAAQGDPGLGADARGGRPGERRGERARNHRAQRARAGAAHRRHARGLARSAASSGSTCAVDVVALVRRGVESVRPTAHAKRHPRRRRAEPSIRVGPATRAPAAGRLEPALERDEVHAPRRPRRRRCAANATATSISVATPAIGISHDFLPHVFERFRQEDGGQRAEYGGLGLGLAIVRHLAEMHGGSVSAFSRGAGHGATFTVTLPAIAR